MAENDKMSCSDIENICSSSNFFYENAFYLTAPSSRIAKFIAHYELFKMTMNIPGEIVECGVFKGASICRFIKFRNTLQKPYARKVIGFDIFGKFPLPDKNLNDVDMKAREHFVSEAGDQSISEAELYRFLKECDAEKNVELVAGDVSTSIPKYLEENPQLKIALLNIDVDLYKPTLDCLTYLFDRVVSGGVVILDDYGGFPGATQAIDDFFSEKSDIDIVKIPWSSSPAYVIRQ